MSDKFLEDVIGEWVELAAHACRTVSTDLLWGDWQTYDWHQDLDVVDFLHGGTEIHFLRPVRKSRTRAIVSNIRPSGIVRNEQVFELPQGSPKTVDGATIVVENWDSPAPLPFHYSADLEQSAGKTKGEALAIGFTESVEFSFGFAQGAAGLATSEQSVKLGFEARQDKTSTSGSSEGERELRSAGIEPVCPAGYDIEYRISRTTQASQLRRTGDAELDFEFAIGKHGDGHWRKKHGKKHHYYKRHLHWACTADFMATIKGEGRRDFDAALHFRQNPAPAWLIRRLEAAMPSGPYSAETPVFDGWTHFRPRARPIRDPNPKFVKVPAEDENEDED